MAGGEIVQPEPVIAAFIKPTKHRNNMEELKTIEDVAEYQKALMLSYEAGEITAEKLKAAMYASKIYKDTLKELQRAKW